MSQGPPAAPELAARAPRPPVVRLRREAAIALVLGAASLVGGALCWSFIAAPQFRAAERKLAQEAPKEAPPGKVRPTELVTGRPASYDRLATELPEPRLLGESGQARQAPRRAPARGASRDASQAALLLAQARQSPVLIVRAPRPAGATGASTPPPPSQAPVSRLAAAAPLELKAGSIITARLLTAVDTSRPGPVVAVVSTDVFDTLSGRQVLVAQGSKLIGRYDGASRYGDRRAFLTWDRLILANGKTIALSGEPGVDAQGASGVVGKVDRRLGQLSLATLFSGAISTIGQAARSDEDTDSFFLNVGDAAAIEAARVGGKLIDREMQVTPSIRLEPGMAVRVLLTRDLALEPVR